MTGNSGLRSIGALDISKRRIWACSENETDREGFAEGFWEVERRFLSLMIYIMRKV